ncbi:hypothetical protein NN561_006351 [Cricetulus griseus]
MTSAASLPEQSPSGGCCSLTGAEARTSAAGPWRRCSPQRRLPPPHLPARGGGGSEIKATEERIGATLGLQKGGSDSDLPSLSWSPGVYK